MVGGRRRYAAPSPPGLPGGPPTDLAASPISIWVGVGRTVHGIDTRASGRADARVSLPSPVGGLALADGVVWVALPGTRRI